MQQLLYSKKSCWAYLEQELFDETLNTVFKDHSSSQNTHLFSFNLFHFIFNIVTILQTTGFIHLSARGF